MRNLCAGAIRVSARYRPACHLKSIDLLPGNYTIDIREPGHDPFTAKIYVVAGKTTRLRPEL
jgi:hypothetical protein